METQEKDPTTTVTITAGDANPQVISALKTSILMAMIRLTDEAHSGPLTLATGVGIWQATPTSPTITEQSCVSTWLVPTSNLPEIRHRLSVIARLTGQSAIALAVGDHELIGPCSQEHADQMVDDAICQVFGDPVKAAEELLAGVLADPPPNGDSPPGPGVLAEEARKELGLDPDDTFPA